MNRDCPLQVIRIDKNVSQLIQHVSLVIEAVAFDNFAIFNLINRVGKNGYLAFILFISN